MQRGYVRRRNRREIGQRGVPRETWHEVFSAQGARNPLPSLQMIDGFNEGCIEFAGTPRQGAVALETVLRELIQRSGL